MVTAMSKCPICSGTRWIKLKPKAPEQPCFKCNKDGNYPRDPKPVPPR